MRKLCLPTKFLHQKIRWNYYILRRRQFWIISLNDIFEWYVTLFIFQTKVAYTRSHTSDSFYCQAEQKSEKIFLDRDKEYYYEAYLGDGGGSYYLQLGLLGSKTQHTASEVANAQDEIQKIRIYSTYKKATQVCHKKVFIWHCFLVFFPSKYEECYITGQWGRVHNKLKEIRKSLLASEANSESCHTF